MYYIILFLNNEKEHKVENILWILYFLCPWNFSLSNPHCQLSKSYRVFKVNLK